MSGLVNESADARSKTITGNFRVQAWVNFVGSGTVSINGSGNVSSITDSGVGDYLINFSTKMPNTNYSAVASATKGGGAATDSNSAICNCAELKYVDKFSVYVHNTGSSSFDSGQVSVAVFL